MLSHVGSICVGVPHIRFDLASPVETAGNDTRSAPASAFLKPGRGRGRGIAFTISFSGTVSRTSITVPLPVANQHFTPSCPGSRSRHVAWEPGWAAQTAFADDRHSAWAVEYLPKPAIMTARAKMKGTLIIDTHNIRLEIQSVSLPLGGFHLKCSPTNVGCVNIVTYPLCTMRLDEMTGHRDFA